MTEYRCSTPAATVLTIRDGDEWLRNSYAPSKHVDSDFVGGAYVFPGGAGRRRRCSRRLASGSDDEVPRRASASSGAAWRTTWRRLRELFEEAGLLIACDQDGAAVALHRRGRPRSARGERRGAQRRRARASPTMLAEEGLRLDLRGVEYLAHWVTPVGLPRRYDTRFFVALAPSGQVATHDAGETVADRWVRPADALAAHARGEFEMMLPDGTQPGGDRRTFVNAAEVLDVRPDASDGRAVAAPIDRARRCAGRSSTR